MHFEITLSNIELRQGSWGSSDTMHPPLRKLLMDRKLGWIKRGGVGISHSSIEVEVGEDWDLMDAVDELRDILAFLEVPASTKISLDQSKRFTWLVYEGPDE
jgi:hypothetical protein